MALQPSRRKEVAYKLGKLMQTESITVPELMDGLLLLFEIRATLRTQESPGLSTIMLHFLSDFRNLVHKSIPLFKGTSGPGSLS